MIDRLHYISQAEGAESDKDAHLAAIKKVLIAGGKWVQLRIKGKSQEQILPIAIAAAELCDHYGAKLIVNDHPIVALKSGAKGVHLGLDDMPVAAARALLGPDFIIGGTANTLAHIQQRSIEGADYIGLGPYKFTTTKDNLSPIIGLRGYRDLIEQAKEAGIMLPLIAIGGIEVADVPLLMKTGIHGVAISGALTNQRDTAKTLYKILENLPD